MTRPREHRFARITPTAPILLKVATSAIRNFVCVELNEEKWLKCGKVLYIEVGDKISADYHLWMKLHAL